MPLTKSKIEYLDYNWPIVTGCNNRREGLCGLPCWAAAQAKRFGKSFEPAVHPANIDAPLVARGLGATIGAAFTGELFTFAPETPMLQERASLRQLMWAVMAATPLTRYLFLTKRPADLAKWEPFPRNAYVGVSVNTRAQFEIATVALGDVKAGGKWLSWEPVLEPPYGPLVLESGLKMAGIGWVVIGAATGRQADMTCLLGEYGYGHVEPYSKKWALSPPVEGVLSIIEAADKAGAKVWLKHNLAGTFGNGIKFRQQRPWNV